MPDYKEIVNSIDVPPNTGVDGFLHTVRTILDLPRVQSINIDGNGKVTYKHFVADDDEAVIGVEFKGLEPWYIIRNAEVQEMLVEHSSAATVVASLLDRMSLERLHPIAFVTGANSVLWEWYRTTTGDHLQSNDYLFGLPLYLDRNAPDSVLLLCAGYSRSSALIDTKKSYKIEMSVGREQVPLTTVEVI